MKILAVFLNENKRLWREKGLILILLLMPLAFIVPIGILTPAEQPAAVIMTRRCW